MYNPIQRQLISPNSPMLAFKSGGMQAHDSVFWSSKRMNYSPRKGLLCLAFVIGCLLPAGIFATNSTFNPVKGPVIQNVRSDRATVNWVTYEGAEKVHSVEITGLGAGTRHDIDMKKYGVDARVSFDTPPADPKPFSFVVFGDTRSRHEVHKRIVSLIMKEHASFVIHTGDLVGNGNSESDWTRFFEIERDLLRTAAFYPVLGNHERNAKVYYEYFSFPEGNGRRYSFDWGTAHFAALDTNDSGEVSFHDDIRWLKNDLARNKKPLTFVVFHHPLYTAVESRRGAAANLAAMLEPTLLAGRVTAVFGGHDHNYQHHMKDGIHYIVAGGGGAPLYDVSPISGLTLKVAKIENFVRVHVTGDKAQVDAVDIEGNLLESFELEPAMLP